MAPIKKNKVHFPKDKKNFEKEMKNNSTSFVKFYSPTCGHCSNMQNAWDGLNTNNMLDHVGLFEVDVTQNPTVPDSCNIPQQTGVPYIILIDNKGNKLVEYMGDRSTHDMEKFILSNAKPEHRQRRRAGGRTKKNKRRYRQTTRKNITRKNITRKTITRKTITRKRTIKRKYL